MARFSRRGLLRLGVASATLAAGAAIGLRGLRGSVPDAGDLSVLSPGQYQTLQALAAVHLPATPQSPKTGADFDLGRLFDRYLADQPTADQRDARLALELLEYGPVLFDGRATTFCGLTPDEQLRHWASWSTAARPLRREIYWSFARFLGLAYYDQAEVWPSVGYPGPSLARLQR